MPKLGVLAIALFAAAVGLLLLAGVSQQHVTPGPDTQRRWTVVVDAGHGGHDPGAVVDGVQEKDIALSLALRVAAYADAYPELEVLLTRASDRYVELVDRVRLAEAVGADLYLSVHANANAAPSICGVETWVHSAVARSNPSWALAEAVQAAVVRATGAPDRGVLQQQLYLRHTYLPAALVEVGYMTCPAELPRLLDTAYQERIARGIVDGLLAYLRTHG